MSKMTELTLAKLNTSSFWIALGLIAVVVIALGFRNWRAGVKAALVIVLFEGALRRYVVPGAQELIYIIKDALLAGAYLRFFFAPDVAVRQSGFKMGTRLRSFILLAVCCVSLSAFSPNLGSPLLAIFGIAIYLFYLPLVVMMPHLFISLEDLKESLVNFAFLALPICSFGIYQWLNPADNYLSVFSSGERSFHRVTSTFSYITGYRAFVWVYSALHLGLLCTSLTKRVRTMLLINLALLTASAVSTESRSLLTQLTLCVLLFFGFTVWINRTRYAKVIAALSLSVICGGVVWAAVFSHPTHERSNVDGPPYFLQSQAKMLMTAWSETSAFGYGIGSSHPATERLRSHLKLPKPHVTPPIWDNELVQVYVELGLVGFSAWYTLRIVLLVLSVRAVKEAARGDARSLYLSMALIQLGSLFFPFVMNATAGLLVTAVAGLSLSAKRLSVGAHTT